jgi:ribosomal protein S18 acetylase RimI-like enzyme
MNFLTITATDDPYLPFIKELYYAAFPEAERRDWQSLLNLLGTQSEMWMQVIEEDGLAIGFWVFWVLGDFYFLEHFAVDPVLRGKRYGERIMQELMQHSQVILEVEPASTENALRRIAFYERLGFTLLSFPYFQPCYRDPEASYPMLLMINSVIKEEELQSKVIEIKEKVYGDRACK